MKLTPDDYPVKTDLGRNVDDLYIGGGLTRDITVLEFELYALFFDWKNYKLKYPS